MAIKYLSQLESSTITEQPVKIPFEFSYKESIPVGEFEEDYILITPLTVRTWFRIRPMLLQIDKEDLEKMIHKAGEMNPYLVEVVSKYDELLVDIVCLGIYNKPDEPPEWFKKVIIDNTTFEDIRILLNAIIYRIGYYPFCNSITTLKNVSPWTETEIIAAQKNMESWHTLAKPASS
ncbi:hypothetical protein EZS27_023613 [termite gut metagenome]|uniref:Uncharacterized protein n=1 Tax=termite gut metagenome TaxID=433724 RepID=A0A5J4R256_9ZZZZ